MGVLLLAMILISAEAALLYLGQRRIFWASVQATGSRPLGYLLAAPGTVLHEASHYLACVLLGVPAGGRCRGPDGNPARVELFRPRHDEKSGSVVLGQVPHAATDPLRGTLIAIAPLLLVPPLLLATTALLLGSDALSDPIKAFGAAPWWHDLLFLYIAFSCGHAAFPSPGDHIPIGGAVVLAGGTLIFGWLLAAHEGTANLGHSLLSVAAIMAVPALAAASALALFIPLARRKASR